MFSAKNKFPLRTEFLAFRAKSKKFSSPSFTVYYHPAPTPIHLSVVVPKKVNKLSTARNWLKRLVYDNLWNQMKDKNLDVVIVFKPLALTKSTQTKELVVSQLNNYVQTLS